jgi:hypothetical protein
MCTAGWHTEFRRIWEQFVNRFDPALTEDVLFCEREKATEQLLNTLMATSGSISFSADSPDEVIAFAIAAIRKAKPEVRLFLEARTLVIASMDAGRFMLSSRGLVYLLREDAAQSPNIFAGNGPTLVPLGRQQRTGSAQPLNRPSGQAMGMAIETMGIPQNKALTYARGCGRSLTALARQIPGGCYDPPPWLTEAPSILSAILAGGWDSANNDDKEVVRVLAGAPDYLQLEGSLRKFLRDSDPPFDREGTVWKVRAPMDAFIHIGHLIGQEHLDALRSAMSLVFSQIEAVLDPDDVVGFPRGLICSPQTGPFLGRVFRAILSWLGGAENDEGIEVFGRAEGVHPEAGSRRDPCDGHLPEGRDQSGDLLQLEEEIRWSAADGDAAAEAARG